ncbi:MAG: LLM class flavin-dependent oxidoreductase [Gammaproteobacteria bacterium]|nr:LLM class flavin-dependent oxidoreductase [Gammaproteobacteria bacterium]
MAVRAGFGIANFPFDKPKSWFEWVQLLERYKVDSVWQTDRLVSLDPYLEAVSVMATLAGCTERIKFGMNAIVAPLRDPLILAKQCATIDYLSNGRLLPMFGVGYPNAVEWKTTNRDAGDRGARAGEIFQLLNLLWTQESVTFEGKYYQYRNVTVTPRPIQQPLPLWIGGNADAALKRTARLGTGWIGGITTVEQVAHAINLIRTESTALGRKIDADHYGTSLAFRIGTVDDPVVSQFPLVRRAGIGDEIDLRPLLAIGTVRQIIERIEAYKAVGASKFVLLPIAMGDADVFDQTRRACEEILPAIQT